MPREPINDGLVNVGDSDLSERQPVREVSGDGVVTTRSLDSIPRVQQIARELCHPWGRLVYMRALSGAASICLTHSMLSSRCH